MPPRVILFLDNHPTSEKYLAEAAAAGACLIRHEGLRDVQADDLASRSLPDLWSSITAFHSPEQATRLISQILSNDHQRSELVRKSSAIAQKSHTLAGRLRTLST